MTQREWLTRARQPSYLGINARMHLQMMGGKHWLNKPLAPMMFHIAVGMSSSVKHDLMRTYLPQLAARRA